MEQTVSNSNQSCTLYTKKKQRIAYNPSLKQFLNVNQHQHRKDVVAVLLATIPVPAILELQYRGNLLSHTKAFEIETQKTKQKKNKNQKKNKKN